QHATELAQVVDDVRLKHMGEDGLQQDSIDLSVGQWEPYFAWGTASVRIVDVASDVDMDEAKIRMPRGDVVLAPGDAPGNDVDTYIHPALIEVARQLDSVAADATANLEDLVPRLNRRVFRVLRH